MSDSDPMNLNIGYRTEQLARHFTHNRVTWAQFYESERVIIDGMRPQPEHSILDIGCGCGGLGLALRERFGSRDYTGVEINPQAAQSAQAMNPQARILCGDILELNAGVLRDRQFELVFSLSCVDWNVQFAQMLAAAWSRVAPGGYLVATFRLTGAAGCNDMEKSYQFINFDGIRAGERAAYVVLNAGQLIRTLTDFRPAQISAYGYWGSPSATAITPYSQLCFCAFAIRKQLTGAEALRLDLQLPEQLLAGMDLPER